MFEWLKRKEKARRNEDGYKLGAEVSAQTTAAIQRYVDARSTSFTEAYIPVLEKRLSQYLQAIASSDDPDFSFEELSDELAQREWSTYIAEIDHASNGILSEIKEKWPDVYAPFLGNATIEALLDELIVKASDEMADIQTQIGAAVLVRELEKARAERGLPYRQSGDFAVGGDGELLRRTYRLAELLRAKLAAT